MTTTPRVQSADLVFSKYKQQGYSELANHEFKTPLAVHPVFLKSPRRVEALVFLMMIALTRLLSAPADVPQEPACQGLAQRASHHDPNTAASLLQLHAAHPSQPPGPRSADHATHHAATRNPSTT